ncbi:TatD family hydrolase [Spirochaetia bacterium 38H-sp]|uniref:TatD family hydrolase n=1 Tax=Rarispira pelagica TaxID=3141764 RepID=A0ABU9UDU7_9SPIR
MRLFDSHSHISLIHEDAIERLIITQEAKQAGIVGIISICNNINDFFVVYDQLRTASNVYHAVGVAPSEVESPGKNWIQKIEEGITKPRVIAIGETGLDYYRKFGDKNSQIELFIKQLELAEKYNLPVIVHNREAGKDILEILKEKIPSRGAVLHCFSENWDFAKKAMDLNIMISLAGNVTYKNAKELQDAAKKIPLDRLLVETESPFMIPAVYRGKRNRPIYLIEIIKHLSNIREESQEEIAEATYQNALSFFNISE